MAMPLALVWDLIAVDKASPGFTRVAASADKAAVATERATVATERSATAMQRANAKIGAASAALTKSVTLPFLAVAGVSLKMAGDFQQATNVLVTAAGESTKNLAMVRKGILDISTSTGTTWKQVTDGLYVLEKAGYRGAKALQVERAAAQGAREEGASLATVTQALTSIMASYHIPASQAVKVMNQMKTAAGESKTTMEQFAGSLSTVLPLASANKISFADIAGSLASLTQHGTSADEAAQELAFTMRGLSAPNQVAVKEMAQLGISSVDVAKKLGDGPGGRGLAGTLNYLSHTVLKQMGPAGLLLLNRFNASKVAAHDAQVEFNNLAPATQKLAKQFIDGSITSKQWVDSVKGLSPEQANLARQFATTENNARGFQQAIKNGVSGSQTYSDAIKKMVGGANGLNTVLQLTGESMDGTNERIQRIQDSAKGAGKNVSGWGSTQKLFNVQMDILKEKLAATAITIGTQLIPVFVKIVGWIKVGVDWFANLSSGTKRFILISAGVVAAIGLIGSALSFLAANPIIAAAAGIAALAGGLIYAYKHSEKFRNFVNKAFATVQNVIQSLMPVIRAVAPVFRDVFNAIIVAVQLWWKVNRPIFEATAALFRATGIALGFAWNSVISPAIQGMAKAYTWLFKHVVGPISKAISAAWSGIGAGLQAAYDHTIGPILNAITASINSVRDALNTLKGNPNGITSSGGTLTGGLTGGTGAGAKNPGPVPHARGGGVADGWFTVGERGFELGYKRGSQVSIFDNARSRQMLGGVNPRGYANGTGDRITTGTLGGRKIWIYGGTDYGSLLGATNAYNRDHNKKNKDVYSVDGKKYTTLIGAENHAQTLMAAKIRLDVKVDTKDLPRFSRAIKGTVDQARAAFGFLFSDARTAGVSSHLLKHLKAEDHQLNLEIGKRNAIADKLKAVRDKMSSLASSVRSGVSGVFDVTSAGANPVTGYITSGSLFAQQAQALTQIRKFSSAIRKLEHRHLNKAYLMQLASQGPSVLPQLEALLSMPARQFSQFNAQAGAISAAGAALGTNVANSVYGNQAAALARQEKAENRRAEKLAHTIAHELAKAVDKETSRPIDVKVNGKTLLEITRKAVKESAR